MCSWVSPPTMWTVVTRTMLDPSPTFPSMRETFAFHGRAAIRSGAGDLGNEGGRDPGGDGAPSPGEAIALPGQTPFPGPRYFSSSCPRPVPARRLELPLLLASFLRYPHPPGNGLVVGQLLQVPDARPGAVAVEDDRQPVSHEDGRDHAPSLDKLAIGNRLPVHRRQEGSENFFPSI